jgi:diguanylate cyclase (GGDEF)-like protein
LAIHYLLSSAKLEPAQLWRLASTLFDHWRSLVEGSAALVFVQLICAERTGWTGFLCLAAATVAVLTLRLVHRAWFRRRSPTDMLTGKRGPDAWAREFAVGAVGTALMWAATDATVILRFDDAALQLMVLVVQVGWTGGSAIRNAASPAVVYSQTIVTSVACIVALLLRQPSFVQVITPFFLLHIVTNLNIMRFTGRQIVTLMESEQRLENANDQLIRLSDTDGLTGIANRRALDAKLAALWARAIRERGDIALLMIDVDHFKLYNDRYGHLRGDDCLRSVARCVAGALARDADVVARYGGEEFATVLPGTTEYGARIVAERVRQAVLAANIAHSASPFGQVTVSIGVASMAPECGDGPHALITLADHALYEAKAAGRNQVRGAVEKPDLDPWRTLRTDPVERPPG